jgi:hypothetical protein
MPSVYLKDFKAELGMVGDVVFKGRYRTPVLIVVGKAAELVDGPSGGDKTMVAERSAASKQATALVDRVFPVAKAPHAQRGPIMLGRSGDNDIAIPEYSISKRQCYFEFEADGIKITDCGSTNGTLVDDDPIPPREPVVIRDGTKISLGRFAFVFHTANGFHAYVKSLTR